jgi:hypothetical protein
MDIGLEGWIFITLYILTLCLGIVAPENNGAKSPRLWLVQITSVFCVTIFFIAVLLLLNKQ